MSPQETHLELEHSTQEPLVTVVGESLVDIINDPRPGHSGPQNHPGGSPLNVAVGCARLDLRTKLITHFAEDRYGDIIARHLAENHVETIVGGPLLPTSTAAATLDDNGAAQYSFSITWDLHGASIPALAAATSSRHVHTGSIATVLTPGNKAVRGLVEAARAHATISFDPNCRPAISPDRAAARQQAEEFVAASDVVKASDEDLQWLYPDRSLDESLHAWLSLGPAIVAVTRGANGPIVLSRSGRVDVPGEPVRVADTVGAGDSFMAALISGLAQLDALGLAGRKRLYELTQDQLRVLANYANKAAGITCSRAGANPPDLHDIGLLSDGILTSKA